MTEITVSHKKGGGGMQQTDTRMLLLETILLIGHFAKYYDTGASENKVKTWRSFLFVCDMRV